MGQWWDGFHGWGVAIEAHRFFTKDRLGRQEWGASLYMREQLECMELAIGEDPNESLWVRITERTGKGDIIVGV